MDSEDGNSDTTERVEALKHLLDSALKAADALDFAIVGIRISEALDSLHAYRNQ